MEKGGVGLVILAAGESRRMGSPKQLLPYKGRSLLRHAVETALESGCRPVVVVVGSRAAEMRSEIEGLSEAIVENESWGEGMGSSIRVGMSAVVNISDQLEGVVLMLCDQPLISGVVIDKLVAAFYHSRPIAVASEYDGAIGVPALFSRELFEELQALKGEQGAKGVLLRHQEEVVLVNVPEGKMDVDGWEDYEKLGEGGKGKG